VKDTGPGIPLEQQTRIFEPFATSLQTRRRNEGVGLGLTITRHLVLLHGGSLTLESQPGLGSTFSVYMPLPSLGDKPMQMPENGQAVLVAISSAEGLPATIVELCKRHGWASHVVRGEADLRQLLTTVRPAALAWDLAHATPIDWSLIQKLQTMPALAQLPFMLYGSSTTPELGVGVTNFLTKPLGQSTLLATINALRPASSGVLVLVDDDPQARKLYAQTIAQALPTFTLQTVEDGAQALTLLETVTPALVILDLQMPEVDGFTVLEAMRARPATRRVPVLVLSGRTLSDEDVRRLNQMHVTFHSKNILSEAETQAVLQRALTETGTLPPQTSLVVKQAIAYLHQNYPHPISRQALAATLGVSKDYLSHIFQQELGLSPWEFLTRYRIQKAKELLHTSHETITHIAAQVGLEDLSYFNRVFRKHVGCSPTTYRQKVVSP
jgi:AraC-like DNA-binding protein